MVTAAAVAAATRKIRRTRRMVARNEESQSLRGAIWHEQHFDDANVKKVIAKVFQMLLKDWCLE